MDLKKLNMPQLKNLLLDYDCAVRRAEIDCDDIERYGRLLRRRKEVREELERRKKE